MKGFSFFEVDKASESSVINAFNDNVIHSGKTIAVEVSRPESAVDRYRDFDRKNTKDKYPKKDKPYSNKDKPYAKKGKKGKKGKKSNK